LPQLSKLLLVETREGAVPIRALRKALADYLL
jgi:hypothetical protein